MSEVTNKQTDGSVNSATIFKPENITIELGGDTYSIVFDMNAFCELEKIYKTIDAVIKKVLGKSTQEHKVFYKDELVEASAITVDGKPLVSILATDDDSAATASDTLNILYCGLMHDLAIYNEHDEITGYKKSKREIASCITFKNIRDVNIKLAMAFIQDLVPTVAEAKNETGAEEAAPQGLHYSAE